jgi:galactokinase
MSIRDRVLQAFRSQFARTPEFLARAPGRVNLLGEHVDYNDGFVLPAAIDRATWVAFGRAAGPRSVLLALDLGETAEFDAAAVSARGLAGWRRYPAGVQWSLNEAGLRTPALQAVFASDVPRGAGLSSSAALEMAFAVAWQQLGGWRLDPMELARLAQQAENEYVGVHCGIMDQFASACGQRGRLLLLDCRSLDWRSLSLPGNAAIVIADTSVRRALAASGYNQRREACERAVRFFQGLDPAVRALRDVPPAQFEAHAGGLPQPVARRARHVVGEIARTRAAVKLLEGGDLAGFGELMDACHASLRDLYEVSCPELDLMAGIARGLPGCLGARLTGAGFGGCTVNLVERQQAAEFTRLLAEEYTRRSGLQPEIYACQAEDGAAMEAPGAVR